MKNTLLITTLLAAGTLGAMAEGNIDDRISGYDYSDSGGFHRWFEFHCSPVGSSSRSGVTNYNWGDSYDINLGQDARYEIEFTVSFKTSGDVNDSIFNIYLAADRNSILFGNYYDIGSIGNRGAADVFLHPGVDVGNGDLYVNAPSYVLNANEQYDQNSANWKNTSVQKDDLTADGNTKAGEHTYRIVIEAFADYNAVDKVKFVYRGPNDTDGTWTADKDIEATFNNINPNAILDLGHFVDDEGGSVVVTEGRFSKLSRVKTPETPAPTPTPTPPPTAPEVPEPSAFGMLAGAGALALVAARRRRSRS
ncbi:MAG: PEP-CTERM sorting domain-containing protein [Verrucomicrobia bacterium]|nr:PEP-CTERM sorting domain-containing protein [Verrucomicrobiota bacterium]